jgi:hypothetical protein
MIPRKKKKIFQKKKKSEPANTEVRKSDKNLEFWRRVRAEIN